MDVLQRLARPVRAVPARRRARVYGVGTIDPRTMQLAAAAAPRQATHGRSSPRPRRRRDKRPTDDPARGRGVAATSDPGTIQLAAAVLPRQSTQGRSSSRPRRRYDEPQSNANPTLQKSARTGEPQSNAAKISPNGLRVPLGSGAAPRRTRRSGRRPVDGSAAASGGSDPRKRAVVCGARSRVLGADAGARGGGAPSRPTRRESRRPGLRRAVYAAAAR